MFIRENRNRSGSISIQVIEKVKGRSKVLYSAGSGESKEEIDRLKIKAQQFIDAQMGTASMFYDAEDLLIESFVSSLSNDSLRIVGPQKVLQPLFKSLFSPLKVAHFENLVLCRIIYPGSKLRTIYYLSRHFNETVSEQTIYRAMDNFDDKLKELVEGCVYAKVLEHNQESRLSLVFYDMTTLYFESESEDDLRKTGYSKDGKHQHPQIMIGLLVDSFGYPVAYDIFEGNQSETKTLVPVIERLIKRFTIDKPIVVADAALLSKQNLQALQDSGYQYVLGGRIKNESTIIKQGILSLKPTHDEPIEQPHPFGRLIVSYSEKRKSKDAYNRKKGLERLEKKVRTGKLNKQHVNNRGYNKYLKLEGSAKISIDYKLFEQDAIWDGLKGYVTNTKLPAKQVITSYSNLWQVEKAFRMSKTDLRFRPIFHRKERRIKAHLLICFAAYALYKELEIKLLENEIGLSVQKAIDQLKEVQALTYRLPKNKQIKEQLLKVNPIQEALLNLKF